MMGTKMLSRFEYTHDPATCTHEERGVLASILNSAVYIVCLDCGERFQVFHG